MSGRSRGDANFPRATDSLLRAPAIGEAFGEVGTRPTGAGDRYICLAGHWPLAMLKLWYGNGASQQNFAGKVGCRGNGSQQCRQQSLDDESPIDQRLAAFWPVYPVPLLSYVGLSTGRLLR